MRRKKSKPTKERLASVEEILTNMEKRLDVLDQHLEALAASLVLVRELVRAVPPPSNPVPEAPKPPGY